MYRWMVVCLPIEIPTGDKMEKSDRTASLSRRNILKQIVAGGIALGSLPAVADNGARSVAAVELSPAQRELKRSVKGTVFWKSEPDYELARGRAVWRANKPNRFPAVVVFPNDAADVVTAVRYAKKHGLKVGTRSGGHSWQSPHVRDGAMLLDLSKMQNIEVDPATQTVWTNPGVFGSAVNFELAKHGLITPTAHHIDVGIGGFVLCGGFGWNSRLWGNGSEHIVGLELVTANGDLIQADADQNSDFYWAARGAGAGFFGVVTRLRLAAHPTPPVWRLSVYSYPVELLEDVFTWARGISDQVAPNVELVITTSAHDDAGAWAPIRITVAALAITDTEADAANGLAILDTCPVVGKAIKRRDKQPTVLIDRYVSGMFADPPGYRFACDNMYTNAPASELVPKLRELFTQLPSPRSHVFWFNWAPLRHWPDMALSVQGDIYLGAYSVWENAADDERMERWPVEQIRKLESLSIGGQMNDENMLAHPQRYLSEAAAARLEALRAKHDPQQMFVSYLSS
jgi:FAD/FMN-containing dehydrogenase